MPQFPIHASTRLVGDIIARIVGAIMRGDVAGLDDYAAVGHIRRLDFNIEKSCQMHIQ